MRKALRKGMRVTVPYSLAIALALSCWVAAADDKWPVPPVWPEDGKIPANLQQQYVFLTAAKDALVVLAPITTDDGVVRGRKAVRIDLHNSIAPAVGACIEESQAGVYSYRYTVLNGPMARDSIAWWWLVLPPHTGEMLKDEKARAYLRENYKMGYSADGTWHGAPVGSAIAQQFELSGTPPGRFASWTAHGDGHVVAPGTSLGGFTVESRDRPGFTTAVFSTLIPIGNSIDQEWPPEIFKQLDFLNDFRWTTAFTLTLGPMLSANASRDEATSNFRAGIKRLIEVKRLDPESAFVHELTETLSAIAGPNAPAEIRALKSKPSTALEEEILSGYQATFRATNKERLP